MDPIKTLCVIADVYPQGISEVNPLLDELTLYSLKEKNFIRPKSSLPNGALVYELTANGWTKAVSSHKYYDN